MNKLEKYKVFNYSNSVCFLRGTTRSYQISAWKSGSPGFVNIPFEEIEYAAARTPFFHTGILGFEDKVKEEMHKELHIDEDKVWTREKIHRLLTKGDKELRQLVLETRDMATMGWLRGEAFHAKNTEEFVPQSVLALIEERNSELMRGQLTSRLFANKNATIEEAPVNREEFSSLMKKNEEMSKQIAQLLAMLGQQKEEAVESAVEETPEEEVPAEKKAPAKRSPKKKE